MLPKRNQQAVNVAGLGAEGSRSQPQAFLHQKPHQDVLKAAASSLSLGCAYPPALACQGHGGPGVAVRGGRRRGQVEGGEDEMGNWKKVRPGGRAGVSGLVGLILLLLMTRDAEGGEDERKEAKTSGRMRRQEG
ncbi:hypothetical protein EYF80_001414 [Liparis tanakae]|uniref:Uncharacterized protein n=1 Tax=Liparis tanakae TaxID=230148 RepID=A0A4Z2JEZ7_9TELE|nr:hypothetical protein EYF80_001414 [Liparis tanakae]